ncbi:protein SENSITIVITY TO RED LIGHT REDUCED 1-like [Pollicipes pollicipes]|uniref:protein SENSITIVITY TO RED LIGHT REDUCED 1-like n=1 Tax=Pollicipes pollicipes TaxID=41117 RepID=UPI0018857C69|nr:protein SENSITIVITY TO RED LIGHT REDUCED 1-like [Pollicipes pollicipes]XP_037087347.1 protein SENSITIVITY TO RED LIGHT REDUCED 1-like [Pollicipes pollicipes]XP_037087348.1 protein SENSITIVITY TO RED LIGHT REDUCED 1-like [Pollicipes pollicipes]XP_037087349.1 protein SENSITIVITY TO RED LIGHT REDUCED 1-like [Pollicipes pollicipes]XP_037087950.1 protein SENSITIVITY TO RED LIGHT REDUCED 1-like [Pollicipes pollicipes]XP_037087951.1 protein SENSITIVITY TO RED LIGHT REDUCED 1-like [Pollicipes polli
MPQVDKDGFILVRHKNSRGPPASLITKGVAPPTDLKPDVINVPAVIKKIERLRVRLTSSRYLPRFLAAVDDCLSEQRAGQSAVAAPNIVCYGLGHVASAPAPQYQLALLLELRAHLSAPRVEAYDPVFWPEEAALLSRLGLHVLEQDEQCGRRLTEPTVLYMPHCENVHYNNLLRANWHPDVLPRCLLIGNSLASIALKLPPSLLREFAFVERGAAHAAERGVGERIDEPELLAPFNDTAVHWFSAARLRALPAYFWDEAPTQYEPPEPQTDSSDDGGRAKPRRRRRKKSRNHN